MAGQLGAVLDRLQGELQIGAHGRLALDLADGEFEAALQRLQHVVEVVREPGGQTPDRLDPLALTDPLLVPHPFGDVLRDAREASGVTTESRDDPRLHLYPAGGAVGPDNPVLDGIFGSGRDGVVEPGPHALTIVRVHRGKQIAVGERAVGIAAKILFAHGRCREHPAGQDEIPPAQAAGLGGEAKPFLTVAHLFHTRIRSTAAASRLA